MLNHELLCCATTVTSANFPKKTKATVSCIKNLVVRSSDSDQGFHQKISDNNKGCKNETLIVDYGFTVLEICTVSNFKYSGLVV